MIWEGKAEEIEDWFDKVFDRKNSRSLKSPKNRHDGMTMELDKRLIET